MLQSNKGDKREEFKVSEFYRIAYRFYYYIEGVTNWVKLRTSPLAITLILSIPVIAVLATGESLFSIVQIASIIGAFLIVSFTSVWFRKANLSISRETPKSVTVGEKFSYKVKIESTKSKKCNSFILCEIKADPRPTLSEFVLSREPQEELRNSFDRRFAFYRWRWLIEQKTNYTPHPSETLNLEKNEIKSIYLEILPEKRGGLMLDDMRVLLPDFLGVFQKCSKIKQSHSKVIVFPKRYLLHSLNIKGNSRDHLGGESFSQVKGSSGEFIGLRDYQPGDNMRQIHWKSWAKVGRPIVKEEEEVFYPRYGMLLDTAIPLEKSKLFEDSVSIAASFACSLDTSKSLLDLIFIQEGSFVHKIEKNHNNPEKMLEFLADVQQSVLPNWEILMQNMLTYAEDFSVCLILLSHWDEQRSDFIKKLSAAGLEMLILLTYENKEETSHLLREIPPNKEVFLIDTNNVQNNLLNFCEKYQMF